MSRRILSLLCALVMLLSVSFVQAEDAESTQNATSESFAEFYRIPDTLYYKGGTVIRGFLKGADTTTVPLELAYVLTSMPYILLNQPTTWEVTITGGTEGNGNLFAISNGSGAGIGGGYEIPCGNIDIQGGYIAATGGIYCAGIGGGLDAICGNITISGGTVRAMGGPEAAGIGGGSNGSCGAITITNGVTRVYATKGGEDAPYSIGAGNRGSCVTVSIGGTVYWENNAAVDNGARYLASSPLIYRPSN